MTTYIYKDELCHYGVPGMKWKDHKYAIQEQTNDQFRRPSFISAIPGGISSSRTVSTRYGAPVRPISARSSYGSPVGLINTRAYILQQRRKAEEQAAKVGEKANEQEVPKKSSAVAKSTSKLNKNEKVDETSSERSKRKGASKKKTKAKRSSKKQKSANADSVKVTSRKKRLAKLNDLRKNQKKVLKKKSNNVLAKTKEKKLATNKSINSRAFEARKRRLIKATSKAGAFRYSNKFNSRFSNLME